MRFPLFLLLVLATACGNDRPDPMMVTPLVGVPDAEHGPSTPDDIDGDGVPNDADNCPSIANADQRAVCAYPPRPSQTGDTTTDALARLNWYRTVLGLPEAAHDPDLSAGCALHVAYLIALSEELGAPQLGHSEDLTKPYASEEGNQAGIDSVLSLGTPHISGAIDGWMNTLYHRLPLIHPGLMRVGIHYETATIGDSSSAWACVLYRQGTDGRTTTPHPVLFPPADIVGTSRTFGGNESPCPTVEDPLGGGPCPGSAAIPSVGLHRLGAIGDVSGTFTNLETGEAVPLFASYFHQGPSPHEMMGYLDGSLALVPEPETTLINGLYEVHVDATLDGTAHTYRWRFRTARALPDVGCDDLGENRDFASAIEIDTGVIEGRVCEFADMYRLTGEGTRTVRVDFDNGEGDLDLVALDPSGMPVGRSEGVGDTEELTVPTGIFVQVYGAAGGMGPYILTVE
jgi:hypothetical protein